MAFYFFLGVIPLLVFVGLLAGRWIQLEGAGDLSVPFFHAMPKEASEFLRGELREGADHGAIAPLSVAGFLWLTTTGIHNLMDVFETLVHARPRPWWKQRLIALLWVVAGLASLAAATWVLLLANGAAASGGHRLPALLRAVSSFVAAGWQRFGVLFVFLGMLSAGLAIFYRTAVVHPPRIRRRVWPGTIVALVLWGLASWAFGVYVTAAGGYSVYYGSLATVAIILLWLYLTSLALVVGAEVNAQLEGMRDPAGAAVLPEDSVV